MLGILADRQCTIYFLSSTGKWRQQQKKSGKRLIKTNVVCKWSARVQRVVADDGQLQSVSPAPGGYTRPGPNNRATGTNSFIYRHRLGALILTKTEDFPVWPPCQPPESMLEWSLVTGSLSQTSNINTSNSHSRDYCRIIACLLIPVCSEAPVCLLPARDCRL